MNLPILPEPSVEFISGHGEPFVAYDKDHMLQFQQDTIKACIGVISDEQDKVDCNWQCKDGVHIVWKLKELK